MKIPQLLLCLSACLLVSAPLNAAEPVNRITTKPAPAAIAIPADGGPVSVISYGNQTHIVQGAKIRTCFKTRGGTVQCP